MCCMPCSQTASALRPHMPLQALALVSTKPPGQLVLHSVPSGVRLSMRLPANPASAACCTWSPCSQQLLVVEQKQALFVCTRHAVVLSQQEPVWRGEVTSVAWGSAGLAAVHGRVDNGLGRLALCRVQGADLPRLELLHLFSSTAFASNLSWSSTGLLLVLAEHGRVTETAASIKGSRVRVTVYVGLSGAAKTVADFQRRHLVMRQPEFVPPGVLVDDLGIRLAWSPDSSSSSLVICGHMRSIREDPGMHGNTHIYSEWPVRQLCFLPSKSRSLWRSLPPLVAWYNPEQQLLDVNPAYLQGLRYGVLAGSLRWVIDQGVWPFGRALWPFIVLEAYKDWFIWTHVLYLCMAMALIRAALARLGSLYDGIG